MTTEEAEPEQRKPGVSINYKPSKLEYTSVEKELSERGFKGLLGVLGSSALVATAGFVADYGFDYHVVGDILKVAGSIGVGGLGLAGIFMEMATSDYVKSYNQSVHHENIRNGFE